MVYIALKHEDEALRAECSVHHSFRVHEQGDQSLYLYILL